MTADPDPRALPHARARETAIILLMLAMIGGLGLAVSWPWRAFYRAETDALARYAPLEDGAATLTMKQGADGRVLLWQGANAKVLRSGEGYATQLSSAARASIEKLYTKGETTTDTDFVELTRGATFIQQRIVELDSSGVVSHTMNIRLRNEDGFYLVSLQAEDPHDEITLSPPARLLPADPQPGKTWESAGQLGATTLYTMTGEIAEADPYDGELGAAPDCIQARIRLQTSTLGMNMQDTRWSDRYCAGIGQVEEVEMDASGAPTTRWPVIASSETDAPRIADQLPPPAAAAAAGARLEASEGWAVSRIARLATGVNSGATVASTYAPTDPPLVLVASYEGDLLGVTATSTSGDVLWRFNPQGTVFGRPAYDAERGRIYFGASDKHLYALDARGLFIWSYETGDNVATRPLVYGDLVIFGSEDRNAYAVEADTGKLRWQQRLGSALVAAPGLAAAAREDAPRDVVIFGSDDGGVFGLEPSTGEQLWEYDAGKAVEAPIVVAGDRVYVASTGGAVVALDAGSGEELWAADLGPTRIVRHAAALTADRVYVVDELGYLNALSKKDGRRLWTSLQADYFGEPMASGDEVLVAADGGSVVRVGPDGVRRGGWSLADASDASDTLPRVDFGPAEGGSALWLIDRRSVLWRIGAPLRGPASLPLAWAASVNEPPFAFDLVRATPVQHEDEVLVLDAGGRLYRVDPQSGAAEATVTVESRNMFVEPIVAGDLLLTAANDGLRASRLSDGGTAWHIQSGASYQPPVVAGDVVVWVSLNGDSSSGVRLAAVEVGTGAVRWQRDFPALSYAGGIAVKGDTVYASTPLAAFDLTSGETRWEAAELTDGVGAPTLLANGSTLYASRVTAIGGEVVALDAATGAIRWQQALPGEIMSILERPWLDGETLVIPVYGKAMVGLNALDGSYRWLTYLPASRFGAITVADGRIYAGLFDGQVVILSTEDGQIVARRGDREGGLESYGRGQRPVLFGQRMIMSFGSSLRAYQVPGAIQ